jgi:predicted metal-dependent HD superfamily phosphohydrolase
MGHISTDLVCLVKSIYDADPTRGYHSWSHVQAALDSMKIMAPGLSMRERGVCELAILYHDIVYIPGFNKNESASSQVLRTHKKAISLLGQYTDFQVSAAAGIIEQTVVSNHISKSWTPPDCLTAIVMDADLSSLATSDWDTFNKNQLMIIKEQMGRVPVGAELDLAKRECANFLNTFLEKSNIYHTAAGRTTFESQARMNIARFIKKHNKIV